MQDRRQWPRMWEQWNSPNNPLNGNMLRITENFVSTPTQLTALKAFFFFSGKRLCDVLENREEIDLPPRMALKEPLQGGTNHQHAGIYIDTRVGYCFYPPTLHLAGAWDTASLPQQGSRMPASSCRRQWASMACFMFLFIIPFLHSPALGINWFVGTREIAASFGCHILNPCQICVARTDASVFNPERIWPLVFSMT